MTFGTGENLPLNFDYCLVARVFWLPRDAHGLGEAFEPLCPRHNVGDILFASDVSEGRFHPEFCERVVNYFDEYLTGEVLNRTFNCPVYCCNVIDK